MSLTNRTKIEFREIVLGCSNWFAAYGFRVKRPGWRQHHDISGILQARW
jgi:hypothetical protein